MAWTGMIDHSLLGDLSETLDAYRCPLCDRGSPKKSKRVIALEVVNHRYGVVALAALARVVPRALRTVSD